MVTRVMTISCDNPAPRKGTGPEDVSTYCLISLTMTISKTVGRMIANRLPWWLEKDAIPGPCIAGFRREHSTSIYS